MLGEVRHFFFSAAYLPMDRLRGAICDETSVLQCTVIQSAGSCGVLNSRNECIVSIERAKGNIKSTLNVATSKLLEKKDH